MFDAPHPANSAEPTGNYVQPTLGHGLRIWWAFYWRTSIASLILALGVNLLLRPLSRNSAIAFVQRYDAYPFYYLVAFFVMAYILRKNFRTFRIALLSNHGAEGAIPLAPTLPRTARVWWAFCWRAVIYRVIAAAAVSFPLGWTVGFLAALLPRPWGGVLLTLTVQIVLDGVVGMFVIYSSILDEDISDFRVGLEPRTASAVSLATAAAPQG
jgi:hypothetical protein